MVQYIEIGLIVSLILCGFGYVFSVMREKIDLRQNQVYIKSKRVTQDLIDSLDYKAFKLGETHLNIGDEIRVLLKDNELIKGTLIGARKKERAICIVTPEDELRDLGVSSIKRLKITTKYGRLL